MAQTQCFKNKGGSFNYACTCPIIVHLYAYYNKMFLKTRKKPITVRASWVWDEGGWSWSQADVRAVRSSSVEYSELWSRDSRAVRRPDDTDFRQRSVSALHEPRPLNIHKLHITPWSVCVKR